MSNDDIIDFSEIRKFQGALTRILREDAHRLLRTAGTHIFYYWRKNRALTNREKARLQSFSDWLVFTGGKESVRKQIGMAMPPKGADAVFRQILETLLKYTIQPCQDIISVEESQSVPQKSRAGNILRFQHEAQEANY